MPLVSRTFALQPASASYARIASVSDPNHASALKSAGLPIAFHEQPVADHEWAPSLDLQLPVRQQPYTAKRAMNGCGVLDTAAVHEPVLASPVHALPPPQKAMPNEMVDLCSPNVESNVGDFNAHQGNARVCRAPPTGVPVGVGHTAGLAPKLWDSPPARNPQTYIHATGSNTAIAACKGSSGRAMAGVQPLHGGSMRALSLPRTSQGTGGTPPQSHWSHNRHVGDVADSSPSQAASRDLQMLPPDLGSPAKVRVPPAYPQSLVSSPATPGSAPSSLGWAGAGRAVPQTGSPSLVASLAQLMEQEASIRAALEAHTKQPSTCSYPPLHNSSNPNVQALARSNREPQDLSQHSPGECVRRARGRLSELRRGLGRAVSAPLLCVPPLPGSGARPAGGVAV